MELKRHANSLLRVFTCPKDRKTFLRKKTLSLLFALLMGVGLWVEIHRRHGATNISHPRYLIALRDLMPGDPVDIDGFSFTFTPPNFPQGKESHALTDQDIDRLNGAVLTAALRQGQYLTPDRFHIESSHDKLTQRLPKGHRAYPLLTVNPWGFHTGDRVNVLFSPEDLSEAPEMVLQNILLVRSHLSESNPEVLLSLTDKEALKMEGLKRKGSFTLLLRSPNDLSSVTPSSKLNPHRTRKIELIQDGGIP